MAGSSPWWPPRRPPGRPPPSPPGPSSRSPRGRARAAPGGSRRRCRAPPPAGSPWPGAGCRSRDPRRPATGLALSGEFAMPVSATSGAATRASPPWRRSSAPPSGRAPGPPATRPRRASTSSAGRAPSHAAAASMCSQSTTANAGPPYEAACAADAHAREADCKQDRDGHGRAPIPTPPSNNRGDGSDDGGEHGDAHRDGERAPTEGPGHVDGQSQWPPPRARQGWDAPTATGSRSHRSPPPSTPRRPGPTAAPMPLAGG